MKLLFPFTNQMDARQQIPPGIVSASREKKGCKSSCPLLARYMRVRPNLRVAAIIAAIHLLLGIGTIVFAAGASLHEATRGSGGSPYGASTSWLSLTNIFTFPLSFIFRVLDLPKGFGNSGTLLAMICQSYCWGLLISCFWCKKHSQ